MRVVLDTSVVVSGLLSNGGAPRELLTLARAGSLELVNGPVLLEELEHVLQQFVRRAVAAEARVAVEEIAQVVEPRVARPTSGDQYPVYLLGTAAAGHVSYLVTRDREVLTVGRHEGVPILEPASALHRIQGELEGVRG